MSNDKKPQGSNVFLAAIAVLIGAILIVCVGILLTQDKHHASKDGIARYAETPKQVSWPFEGHFGTFNRASVQRGFQVYREVCSACHGIKRVAFRNLQDIGFSEAEVKALAAEYTYTKIDNEGEVVDRPGIPADHFPSPFANEAAARAANNGAYPPDLSLMVKARMDGANYLYSLLTGYEDAPADFPLGDGMHYNPYFEGRQIAMAAPIMMKDQVSYEDGTNASIDQMARDVVNFLQWAAEPEMEERKRMGIKVMIFLVIFTVFFMIAKKRIWSRLEK